MQRIGLVELPVSKFFRFGGNYSDDELKENMPMGLYAIWDMLGNFNGHKIARVTIEIEDLND